jgi:hypothetical protein
MQVYLTDNVKRIKGAIRDGEIEELMAGLSLGVDSKVTDKDEQMDFKPR